MKNEKKIFDGDMIYTISTTLFAGTLSIGFILMAAVRSIF